MSSLSTEETLSPTSPFGQQPPRPRQPFLTPQQHTPRRSSSSGGGGTRPKLATFTPRKARQPMTPPSPVYSPMIHPDVEGMASSPMEMTTPPLATSTASPTRVLSTPGGGGSGSGSPGHLSVRYTRVGHSAEVDRALKKDIIAGAYRARVGAEARLEAYYQVPGELKPYALLRKLHRYSLNRLVGLVGEAATAQLLADVITVVREVDRARPPEIPRVWDPSSDLNDNVVLELDLSFRGLDASLFMVLYDAFSYVAQLLVKFAWQMGELTGLAGNLQFGQWMKQYTDRAGAILTALQSQAHAVKTAGGADEGIATAFRVNQEAMLTESLGPMLNMVDSKQVKPMLEEEALYLLVAYDEAVMQMTVVPPPSPLSLGFEEGGGSSATSSGNQSDPSADSSGGVGGTSELSMSPLNAFSLGGDPTGAGPSSLTWAQLTPVLAQYGASIGSPETFTLGEPMAPSPGFMLPSLTGQEQQEQQEEKEEAAEVETAPPTLPPSSTTTTTTTTTEEEEIAVEETAGLVALTPARRRILQESLMQRNATNVILGRNYVGMKQWTSKPYLGVLLTVYGAVVLLARDVQLRQGREYMLALYAAAQQSCLQWDVRHDRLPLDTLARQWLPTLSGDVEVLRTSFSDYTRSGNSVGSYLFLTVALDLITFALFYVSLCATVRDRTLEALATQGGAEARAASPFHAHIAAEVTQPLVDFMASWRSLQARPQLRHMEMRAGFSRLVLTPLLRRAATGVLDLLQYVQPSQEVHANVTEMLAPWVWEVTRTMSISPWTNAPEVGEPRESHPPLSGPEETGSATTQTRSRRVAKRKAMTNAEAKVPSPSPSPAPSSSPSPSSSSPNGSKPAAAAAATMASANLQTLTAVGKIDAKLEPAKAAAVTGSGGSDMILHALRNMKI